MTLRTHFDVLGLRYSPHATAFVPLTRTIGNGRTELTSATVTFLPLEIYGENVIAD
jgi:hypothetical protein